MIVGNIVPRLETDRLSMRGHTIEDIAECASMWADPKVVANISGTPSTYEQSWSRLLRYAGHWCQLGFGYWVVESKADSSFLGEVGLADFRRDTQPNLQGIPEAGWAMKADAQGLGYASEAVAMMLEWADVELMHPTTACIMNPGHFASINVARKSGYSNETVGRYGKQDALFMERSKCLA